MNFCPECGSDLRVNPNAKFCFSCGNKLAPTENVSASHIENDDFVETNNSDDGFDYFDFPLEEKYFNDFMLEVSERIATNSEISNNEIAKKYFERGEDLFEARSIYFKEFTTLGNFEEAELYEADLMYQEYLYSNQDDYIKNTLKKVVNCYSASLYFVKSVEAYYQLFVCYQYGKDYKKAHENLILFAETTKEYFGIQDNRTIEAVTFCRTNYEINNHYNLDNLPKWMYGQDMLPI